MTHRRCRRPALVHEAYIRWVDVAETQHWDSRRHSFAAAGQAASVALPQAHHRGEGVPQGTSETGPAICPVVTVSPNAEAPKLRLTRCHAASHVGQRYATHALLDVTRMAWTITGALQNPFDQVSACQIIWYEFQEPRRVEAWLSLRLNATISIVSHGKAAKQWGRAVLARTSRSVAGRIPFARERAEAKEIIRKGDADVQFKLEELIILGTLFLLAVTPIAPCPGDDAAPAKPTSHVERQLSEWMVRIDQRLLSTPHKQLGARAVDMLEARLADIASVLAPEPLAKLQKVTIVLDLTHGDLRSMQYHPSAEWLAEHGYARDLAKCVHIPDAGSFVQSRQVNEQPWAVLHELAHAYHDQELGFHEPRIEQAYRRFKRSGHGDAALLYNGQHVKHYALTDPKEFFAEMTEAYIGSNDFFPFNGAELLTAEPEVFQLMRDIWGPVERTRSAVVPGERSQEPQPEK